MKTQRIGQTSLVGSRLVYGCMGASDGATPQAVTPQQIEQGKAGIIAAYEAGVTHFDSADMYGRGACDQILGSCLRDVAGMRRDVIVTTKCGVRFAGDPQPNSPQHFDLSAEHITSSCEGALKRLALDTIDLFLLHRPDALMDPSEVADAFNRLSTAGKVRYFGVSNFTPPQLALLHRYSPLPLAVNQVRIHFAWLNALADGTLDKCMELGITPEAYSPVGKGVFASDGNLPDDHPKYDATRTLLEVIDETAARYGATRTAITLAWLLRHPSGILPIIGTSVPDRIRDSVTADAIELSRPDWYRIGAAAAPAQMGDLPRLFDKTPLGL